MKRRRNAEDWFISACVFITTVLVLATMAYPFYYLIVYSISDPSRIRPGFMLFPQGFSFDAYISIFTVQKLLPSIGVSVARAAVGPLSMMVVSSMAAYALAKKELFGRKVFSRLFVFTMYISAGMIPVYRLIYSIGLAHSFLVYIVPTLVDVFSIILIRTYIENIPDGLEEAAYIDGAGYFQTYLFVVIPICKPILATVALFSIVNHWNAYTDTMFYNAADKQLHTLSYILMQYMKSAAVSLETARSGGGRQRANIQMIKMAITVVATFPILCVYPMLQKYFVQGIMVGAIKG